MQAVGLTSPGALKMSSFLAGVLSTCLQKAHLLMEVEYVDIPHALVWQRLYDSSSNSGKWEVTCLGYCHVNDIHT